MTPFDTDKLLDDTGRRILVLLQENARLSFSEIGRQVGLTQPAVAERIRRMEETGIITGYHAAVNPEKMGRGVNVFIHVTASDGRYERIEAFARRQHEITECYCIAGKVDVLIKASFASLSELRAVVDKLAQFGSVESSIILGTYVSRRALEYLDGTTKSPPAPDRGSRGNLFFNDDERTHHFVVFMFQYVAVPHVMAG